MWPERAGLAAERPLDQSHVVGVKQQRFRIRGWISAAVLLFIERVGWRVHAVTPVLPPKVAVDFEAMARHHLAEAGLTRGAPSQAPAARGDTSR